MSQDNIDPFEGFGEKSGESFTTGEKLVRLFDLWIRAPFTIMWDDMRTRIGGAVILFFVLVGTVGPVVIDRPEQNEGELVAPPLSGEPTSIDLFVTSITIPEPQFLLGADGLGRSLLELMVHSTPAMWKMVISGAVLSVFIGTAIGIFAGYNGGRVDRVLMSITDIVLAIPGLPLIIVLTIALQPRSPWIVGLFLGIDNWPGLSRAVRAQTLSLREESYVEASTIMNVSTAQIALKDILPNIMPWIMISFMISATRIIYESVGLYFLGVLPFTNQNWGVILNTAYNEGALFTPQAWHWLFVPMATISLFGFGLVLFSQGMDRVFNPRVRARHVDSTEDDGPIDP